MNINIVCYWWGDWTGYWGPRYVEKLYNGLMRNTKQPFRFWCFTDCPQSIYLPTIRFNPSLRWNLNKFICFHPAYNLKGRVLTIDLDTVITGNIDHLLSFTEEIITCEAAYHEGVAGGSLVGTTVERGRELLSTILENQEEIEEETGGSERFFLRNYVEDCQFWQHNYHGIYSYKVDCKNYVPEDAKIIRFHGKPRPHEIVETSELVQKYWI